MGGWWERVRGALRGEAVEPEPAPEVETVVVEPASPGPLFRGAVARGLVRSERDYLCAVSVRFRNHNRRIDTTATLTLLDGDEVVRTSRRSTLEVDDGAWLRFPFASIAESEGREYRVAVETDAEDEAVEASVGPDGRVECRAHPFPELATMLDPLFARDGRALPPIPEYLRRYLDRHVYACVDQRRYFFARLVHLADAVGRIPEPVSRAIAIGSGAGYQEAFLAGRFPGTDVLATDVERQLLDFPMPNLRFDTLDLLAPPREERFDLVFSIETLEHVPDPRTAFRNKAALVRPGGHLYISVPFASREEQKDERLRRLAWEAAEHYTPGFDYADLEELFAENGLEVVHAANMFHTDLIFPLRELVERLSPAELESGAGEIARLYLRDVRDVRATSIRQAEGIRFLGRKPA